MSERPWLKQAEAFRKSFARQMSRFEVPKELARHLNYILVDREVVPADLAEWSAYYEWASQPDPTRPGMTRRHVDHIVLGHEGIGEIRVSTVFLGVEHRFFGDGPPLVFETMIFGGGEDLNNYTTRCSTWDEALQMHANAVEVVKNAFAELAKVSGA